MSHQHFAPLDTETRAALKASIERFGVVQPIIVDGNGQIIDGHHRFDIAKELGRDCPIIKRAVRNEDDATALAYSLNAHRRMLSVAERRAIVADLREQGYSLRAIQGVTGSSLGTVTNDVKATGATPKDGTTTGADGRHYQPERPKDDDEAGVQLEHLGADVAGGDESGAGEEVSQESATPPPATDPQGGDGAATDHDAPASPPSPPIDPTLGYRARATAERSKVRAGLLTLDPERVVETTDERHHWEQFSDDVRAWLDDLDWQLSADTTLRAVK